TPLIGAQFAHKALRLGDIKHGLLVAEPLEGRLQPAADDDRIQRQHLGRITWRRNFVGQEGYLTQVERTFALEFYLYSVFLCGCMFLCHANRLKERHRAGWMAVTEETFGGIDLMGFQFNPASTHP